MNKTISPLMIATLALTHTNGEELEAGQLASLERAETALNNRAISFPRITESLKPIVLASAWREANYEWVGESSDSEDAFSWDTVVLRECQDFTTHHNKVLETINNFVVADTEQRNESDNQETQEESTSESETDLGAGGVDQTEQTEVDAEAPAVDSSTETDEIGKSENTEYSTPAEELGFTSEDAQVTESTVEQSPVENETAQETADQSAGIPEEADAETADIEAQNDAKDENSTPTYNDDEWEKDKPF